MMISINSVTVSNVKSIIVVCSYSLFLHCAVITTVYTLLVDYVITVTVTCLLTSNDHYNEVSLFSIHYTEQHSVG